MLANTPLGAPPRAKRAERRSASRTAGRLGGLDPLWLANGAYRRGIGARHGTSQGRHRVPAHGAYFCVAFFFPEPGSACLRCTSASTDDGVTLAAACSLFFQPLTLGLVGGDDQIVARLRAKRASSRPMPEDAPVTTANGRAGVALAMRVSLRKSSESNPRVGKSRAQSTKALRAITLRNDSRQWVAPRPGSPAAFR